jgi:hypothetical protein
VHLSYIGATDAWTSLRKMPTERDDHGAAIVGSSLFAVGGHQPSPLGLIRVIATAEKYDLSTDTWTTVTEMPSARDMLSGSAVRAMGSKLVVIGGYYPGSPSLGGESDIFEMYTPSTDTWETKTPMPTMRLWFGLDVISSRIYTVGGSAGDPSASPSTSYARMEVWGDTSSYSTPAPTTATPSAVTPSTAAPSTAAPRCGFAGQLGARGATQGFRSEPSVACSTATPSTATPTTLSPTTLSPTYAIVGSRWIRVHELVWHGHERMHAHTKLCGPASALRATLVTASVYA